MVHRNWYEIYADDNIREPVSLLQVILLLYVEVSLSSYFSRQLVLSYMLA